MAGNIVSQLAEQSQQNHERLKQIKAQQPQPVNAADVTKNLGQKLNMPSAGVQQSQVPDWREGLNDDDKKIAEENYNNLSQNQTDDFFQNFIDRNTGRKIKLDDKAEWDSDVEAYRNWIELNYGDEQNEDAKAEKENRLKQLDELIAMKEAEIGQNGERGEPTDEGTDNPNGDTTTPDVEGTTPGAGGTTTNGGGSANVPTAEGGKSNSTPSAHAEQDMTTFNYATGQPLPADASNKDIARAQDANRVGDAIWKLYQVNPNPSASELEAALKSAGDGALLSFNRMYGNKKDNWAAVLGGGGFFGNVTKAQRASAAEYVRKRKEYEESQKKAKDEAAAKAHEAQYTFTLGDGDNAHTITIDETISNNVKSIEQAYARLAQQEAKLTADPYVIQATADQLGRVSVKGIPSPDSEKMEQIKQKRKKVVAALQTQLNSILSKDGTPVLQGEFDTIEDLIAAAPDYQTENAIMKALGLAEQYTPYKPEEDTRSFEERMADRQKQKEEIDLQTRNRELERARNRASFADLAATIGDITRASQGGRVDPRDWQQMYDNLTAQERANVDNYRTRMQKIEDDIKQQKALERKLAADRQAQIEKQQHEKEMQRTNIGWEGTKQNRDLAAKLALQQIKDAAAKKRAEILANAEHKRAQTNIPMFGQTKFIDASQNDNTLVALYGKLKGMTGLTFGIPDGIVGTEKIQEIKALVIPALQNAKETESGDWIISYPAELGGGEKILSKQQVQELLDYVDEVGGNSSNTASSTRYSSSSSSTSGNSNQGKGVINVSEYKPR